MEMMEDLEITGDIKKTQEDEKTVGKETDTEDDKYRCKHYRRKCQFVVSINWFVYNWLKLFVGCIENIKKRFYQKMTFNIMLFA